MRVEKKAGEMDMMTVVTKVAKTAVERAVPMVEKTAVERVESKAYYEAVLLVE